MSKCCMHRTIFFFCSVLGSAATASTLETKTILHLKFCAKVVSSFHIFLQPDLVSVRTLQTLDVKRVIMYYIDGTKPFSTSNQLFCSLDKPQWTVRGFSTLAMLDG